MGFHDIILGPLFLFITFIIAYRLRNRLTEEEIERKWFLRVFFFKAFAVTFFVLIYQFYYGGGDTFGFFFWSRKVALFFVQNPFKCIQFIFTNDISLFYEFKYNYYVSGYGYLLKLGTRELTFIKLIAPLNLIAMGSYLAISYIFSLIIFISNWLLYKVFAHSFPDFKKGLIFTITLIPSVAFWGSGVLKDSIVFAGICLTIYCINEIFISKRKIVRNLILLLFSIWIIFSIRSFAILSLIPAVVLWLFLTYNSSIKQKVLRQLLSPIVILVSVLAILGLLISVSNSLGRFSLDNLDQTVKDFQGWHEVASKDGSGYTLNTDNSSILGMLKSFPAAVNVTYFRPYLWETSGVVVLFSAVESFIIFMFFLYVFFIKSKIIGFINLLFSEPLIMLCFVFAIIYGFTVGFTSFNFGALSRYKVPGMPLFVTMLYLIYALSSRKKV